MTCGHIRDSGGGNDCDGCLSVSHQSPDTDVSDADAEIFEVQLNSAKFLSAGRTCVGGCTYVHVYLCDTVCALMRQEVCCLSSAFNKPSFSCPDILFQTLKMQVSAEAIYHTLPRKLEPP